MKKQFLIGMLGLTYVVVALFIAFKPFISYAYYSLPIIQTADNTWSVSAVPSSYLSVFDTATSSTPVYTHHFDNSVVFNSAFQFSVDSQYGAKGLILSLDSASQCLSSASQCLSSVTNIGSANTSSFSPVIIQQTFVKNFVLMMGLLLLGILGLLTALIGLYWSISTFNRLILQDSQFDMTMRRADDAIAEFKRISKGRF